MQPPSAWTGRRETKKPETKGRILEEGGFLLGGPKKIGRQHFKGNHARLLGGKDL